jgi:hypothetical protein
VIVVVGDGSSLDSHEFERRNATGDRECPTVYARERSRRMSDERQRGLALIVTALALLCAECDTQAYATAPNAPPGRDASGDAADDSPPIIIAVVGNDARASDGGTASWEAGSDAPGADDTGNGDANRSACQVGNECSAAGSPCHLGRVTSCTGGILTCADQGTLASIRPDIGICDAGCG